MKFVSHEPHSHLSMLMCKEFSRIVCVSLFSYQGCLSFRQLVYFIISVLLCQALFSSFFQSFSTLSFSQKVVQIHNCQLCSSDLITLTQRSQVVKHFFKFLFSFRNLLKLSLSEKQLFPTAQLI